MRYRRSWVFPEFIYIYIKKTKQKTRTAVLQYCLCGIYITEYIANKWKTRWIKLGSSVLSFYNGSNFCRFFAQVSNIVFRVNAESLDKGLFVNNQGGGLALDRGGSYSYFQNFLQGHHRLFLFSRKGHLISYCIFGKYIFHKYIIVRQKRKFTYR